MSARVVVVHDDPELLEGITAALRGAGYTVAPFHDAMAALGALEGGQSVDLLITRVNFGPATLHGIALARMARLKRPGVRVLFVASPEYVGEAEGLGVFLPQPVQVVEVVATAERLLEAPGQAPVQWLEWTLRSAGQPSAQFRAG
jgi:DNA-binding response OmpR family regulator